jgi:hypothetical protein
VFPFLMPIALPIVVPITTADQTEGERHRARLSAPGVVALDSRPAVCYHVSVSQSHHVIA